MVETFYGSDLEQLRPLGQSCPLASDLPLIFTQGNLSTTRQYEAISISTLMLALPPVTGGKAANL